MELVVIYFVLTHSWNTFYEDVLLEQDVSRGRKLSIYLHIPFFGMSCFSISGSLLYSSICIRRLCRSWTRFLANWVCLSSSLICLQKFEITKKKMITHKKIFQRSDENKEDFFWLNQCMMADKQFWPFLYVMHNIICLWLHCR